MNPQSMRFPGGTPRALTLSYDDGVQQDLRLIELMNATGLRATFNLNSGCFSPEGTVFPQGQIHRRFSRSEALNVYARGPHEIAIHGTMHAHPCTLSAQEREYEFRQDRLNLEAMFSRIIRGAAYAYGEYNEDTISTLRSSGIVYARTVHSTHDFQIPQDFLRLNPTCHHDDPMLFDLLDRFLDPGVCTPHLFYLWGHSYEFEEHRNWDRIEAFARSAGGRKDVWYCTNQELYTYVQSFRSLIESADRQQLLNPSAIPLYLEHHGEVLCIGPGRRISLPS